MLSRYSPRRHALDRKPWLRNPEPRLDEHHRRTKQRVRCAVSSLHESIAWEDSRIPKAGKKPVTCSHEQFLFLRVFRERDKIRNVHPRDALSGFLRKSHLAIRGIGHQKKDASHGGSALILQRGPDKSWGRCCQDESHGDDGSGTNRNRHPPQRAVHLDWRITSGTEIERRSILEEVTQTPNQLGLASQFRKSLRFGLRQPVLLPDTPSDPTDAEIGPNYRFAHAPVLRQHPRSETRIVSNVSARHHPILDGIVDAHRRAACVPWRAPQATSSNRQQCEGAPDRSRFAPASHQ